MIGTVVAEKYKVLEELGKGGFGSVYLVEITAGMVGEKLALKVLSKDVSDNERSRDQFLNEIRVAMRIVDKNIIQLRDVGTTEDGRLYYTMDYSPGVTLREVLREGRIPAGRALRLVRSILKGLRTAHDKGVIHRDLKPGNVMVEREGDREIVRILDFGIATLEQSETNGARGRFAGSFLYTPPEQLLGQGMGFYTDIYAVGVILYESLTGQRPYQGRSPQEVYDDIKSRPAVSPEKLNPELKRFSAVVNVVNTALERNPEKRYQNAADFLADLERAMADPTGRKSPAVAAAPAPATARPAPAAPAPAPAQSAPAPRRRRPRRTASGSPIPVGGIIAGLVAVIAVGLVLVILSGKKDTDTSSGGNHTVKDTEKPTRDRDDRMRPTAPEPTPEERAREAHDSALADAERLERAGQHAEAAAKLDVAQRSACAFPALEEECRQAWRLKGLAELEAGQHIEAATSLGEAVQRFRQANEPDIVVDLLSTLADAHWQGGRRDDAIKLLDKERHDPFATSKLAAKLLRFLEQEKNEERLRAVLSSYEDRFEVTFEGADLRYVRDLFEKYVRIPRKREELQEFMARSEKLAAALGGGDSSFEENDCAKAIERAQTAKKLHLELRAIDTSSFREDFPEDVAKVEKIVQGVDVAKLDYILGVCAARSGNFAQARQHLSLAVRTALDKSVLASAHLRLGTIDLEEYEAAIRNRRVRPGANIKRARNSLEQAEQLVAPDDRERRAEILLLRARCHAHLGDVSRTERDVKSAESLIRRKGTDHLRAIAMAYYFLGAKTKIEKKINTAISRLGRYLDHLESLERKSPKPLPKELANRIGECLAMKGYCYKHRNKETQDIRKARSDLNKAKNGYGYSTPELERRLIELGG